MSSARLIKPRTRRGSARSTTVASVAPARANSVALLAFLPRPDLDRLLDQVGLVPCGPRTLTTKADLDAELAQVRRTGIAVNDEELESALRSIAVPVRSRSGEVVAAINVAIPWSPFR